MILWPLAGDYRFMQVKKGLQLLRLQNHWLPFQVKKQIANH
jgi:hypothetical protein